MISNSKTTPLPKRCTPTMSKLGDTIRQLRIAQQLELRETAHLIGVPAVYLSRLERGKELAPDESILRSIARILAADPEVLLSLCPITDSQVTKLLQQHPNVGNLIQLLMDGDLSDEQVGKVERFIRRELLGESSVSTV